MDDDRTSGGGAGEEGYPTWVDPPAAPATRPRPEPVAATEAPAGVPATTGILDRPDEPEQAPGRRVRPGRWIATGLAGLFLLAGAGVGIKLFALRGSSDVLRQMVPADADVYATAYLDPSLSQKLHLRTLLGRFPALNGPNGVDQRLDELLAQAFEGSGLDFRADVSPWLGTQLGVVVRIDDAGPHPALLVASKDDAAAPAALAKLREDSGGSWTDEQHDGVVVSSGTNADGTPAAYAYFDHTAVISDQASVIEEIIDVDRGTAAALDSTERYAKALEGLPEDRVAFAYVNSGQLLSRYLDEQSDTGALGLDVFSGSFKGLQAYETVGAAVTAESDGVGIHVSVDVDPSKLTAEQRAAFGGSSHRNTVLDWTPRDALGLFAFSRFDETLTSFAETAAKGSSEIEQTLQDLGVTGVDGLIAHMSGDAGLTATAGAAGSIPNVALMIGTEDSGASERFLSNLRDLVGQSAGEFTGSRPSWHVEAVDVPAYGSVQVTYLDHPDLQSYGLSPAFASVRNMTILGSSRDAVKAVLTARGSGAVLPSSPTFASALKGSEADAGTLEYFDVQAIAQAFVGSLSSTERERFERDVKPNLEAVKAFALTQASTDERSTVRMFVLIR